MSRCVDGFVRAEGRQIVNGQGIPFLLRGIGLGNWLLPEGYMWRMPEAADRPRRIEALVHDLLGPEDAAGFWQTYWDRFVTEDDIGRIAAEGFNSLRVPVNARYITGIDGSTALIESRLHRIDRLIGWCKKHRLYVILDLHGAPGGQTGTNIDDSASDRPDLFVDQENQDRTVSIWRSLADRYRDEWIVAGFDLLNEPLPEWFSQYNDQLLPLYRRIIDAIREVDRSHMIILEGAHWATDWSIFTEVVDDNVMLQFHKYWNNPDRESLADYLEVRERLNVPIFMGEGGENNTDWYTGAFQLFEDLDISWNFWTWKKLDTTNSPVSVASPAGWDDIVAYAGGGARPAQDTARTALKGFLDNLPLHRCTYRPEVVRSLFRRPPVRIPAIFYGFREQGESFGLAKEASPSVIRETPIRYRVGDGTRFGYVTGHTRAPGPPNFQHNRGEPWSMDDWLYIELEPGAWVSYDFNVRSGGPLWYMFGIRMACVDGGKKTDGGQAGACYEKPEVILTIDRPEQELKLSIDTPRYAFNDFRVKAEAETGQRRVRVRCEKSPIRVQALYVTMEDTGGATSTYYDVADFGFIF